MIHNFVERACVRFAGANKVAGDFVAISGRGALFHNAAYELLNKEIVAKRVSLTKLHFVAVRMSCILNGGMGRDVYNEVIVKVLLVPY